MKKVIYKYQLASHFGRQEIDLPIGAEILAVQTQHEYACIWALIEPGMKTRCRIIEIIGTGIIIHDAEVFFKELKYIGTCQFGHIVAHVFINK